MKYNECYPWHERSWLEFIISLETNRLHHAWLLQGPKGLMKSTFAYRMAAILLCETTTTPLRQACGLCRACELLQHQTHSDFILPREEEGEEQKSLGVEAIRAIQERVYVASSRSKRKVVLIPELDRLTRAGANALLKTLEEPPPDTIFILVSNTPHLIPATVRSRCRKLGFSLPNEAVFSRWLSGQKQNIPVSVYWQLSGGVPRLALDWVENPETLADLQILQDQFEQLSVGTIEAMAWVEASKAWPFATLIDMLLLWLISIVRSKMIDTRYCVQGADFISVTKLIPINLVYQMLDRLYNLKKAVLQLQSINRNLQLTSFLLDWQAVVMSAQGASLHE